MDVKANVLLSGHQNGGLNGKGINANTCGFQIIIICRIICKYAGMQETMRIMYASTNL